MTKVVLTDVTNILTNPVSAANALNSNNDTIEAAFDNTLSLDGSTPNQLQADIDLNLNDLLNVSSLGVGRIDATSIYINGSAVVPGGGGGGPSDTVLSVAGKTGNVTLLPADVGLTNVDNTSDVNKPVSNAQSTAILARLSAAANLSDVANPNTSLTNLGASTTGIGLITATDAAAARTALSVQPTASPTFTGTVTIPTASPGDNTTKSASTAFVTAAVAALSSVYQGLATYLTNLVGLGSSGFVIKSGTTAAARVLTGTLGISISNPDGISGNPVIFQDGTPTTLSSGATIALDLSTGPNFILALNTNTTLNNPSNATTGMSGRITVVQDATGSRTMSFSSQYKWPGGTPQTLTTSANAIDVISYYVLGTGLILVDIKKGIA